MKTKIIILALSFAVLIILYSILLPKQLVQLPKKDIHNSLDSLQKEIVYKYAEHYPNGTQLSICILTADSEKYTGIERRNDSLIYVDNSDSIFEIGSITKPFTGIMLAKLVYDGKVNPDEPIKNILPIHLKQSSLNGVEITLTHLANHTSGLPFEPDNVKDNTKDGAVYDRYDPYKSYNVDRLYDYLENTMTLSSTPGEIRKYSNLNSGLLGHILTLITGKSYEQLLFETICIPLGIHSTFINFNNEFRKRTVQGRDEYGIPLKSNAMETSVFAGAGSIKSTAKDLAKFLRANMMDTTYFYLAQKTNKVNGEHFTGSFGWETYNEKGLHHAGAFGATGGYTSGIIFERNKRVGVVVLTNVSAYLDFKENYIENLCKDIYGPLPFTNKK